MAFTLPNYPVLDSPFDIGGSMAKGIEMKLKNLEAKKAAAELPWASDLARSKAASQLAYANLANPQMLANLAKDKAFMNTIADKPELQQAIIKGATSQVGGNLALGNLLNNTPNPPPNMPKEQAGLFDNILNYINGNEEQASKPQPNQQTALQEAIVRYMNPPLAQQQGQSAQPIQQQQSPNATQPMTGQSPVETRIATEAKEAEKIANATKTGTVQADQLGDLEKQSQAISSTALIQMNSIKEFLGSYENSWLKGKVLGKFASWGSESAKMLPIQNEMAATLANSLFGSTVTDAKLAASQAIKLNAEMPEQTAFDTGKRMFAAQERAGEFGDFVQTAKGQGIKDPNKILQMWYNYNYDVPFYDAKNQKPINDNVGRYGRYIGKHKADTQDDLLARIEKRGEEARKRHREEDAKQASKGVKIPDFGSKKEALDWYAKQPDYVKDSLKSQLK